MNANITLLTQGNKGNILGILKRSIVANIRAVLGYAEVSTY